MDELNANQYEGVLKYMETVNQQNFEAAVNTMRQYRFNVEMAVNNRFHSTPPRPPQNHPNDQQIVRKYIEFTRRKNESWNIFTVLFDILKRILLALLSTLARLLPQAIYSRFFATPFQKTYSNKLNHKYSHHSLASLLAKTKNATPKSVLLVIAPRKEHSAIVDFLNDHSLQAKLRNNYFLCCYLAGSEELGKIEGYKESPQAIVLRWNIFQEVVEVGREKDLKRVSSELLDRWAHEGRNCFKRDGNVLIKYRNYIARLHGYYYEEEEEQEVNLVQRTQQKKEIQQQNQAYRLVEEQTRRNKERAAQEERQRAQLQEERKYRKMSIPDEPTSGNIIRISFRCPDGSTILRNFLGEEKLELVYHWVQLNEEIEFQDERRQFEIMYSYPPVPLSSRKEALLSEVFQSSQEKVVIREL